LSIVSSAVGNVIDPSQVIRRRTAIDDDLEHFDGVTLPEAIQATLVRC